MTDAKSQAALVELLKTDFAARVGPALEVFVQECREHAAGLKTAPALEGEAAAEEQREAA